MAIQHGEKQIKNGQPFIWILHVVCSAPFNFPTSDSVTLVLTTLAERAVGAHFPYSGENKLREARTCRRKDCEQLKPIGLED